MKQFAEYKSEVGARLFRAGLAYARGTWDTKSAAVAAFKACNGRKKSVTQRRAVEVFLDMRSGLDARLAAKFTANRFPSRNKSKMATPRSLKAKRIEGPIEARLIDRTARKVELVAYDLGLAKSAAGGTEVAVSLTADPAAIGYALTTGANYDVYKGRYKGWAATSTSHRITVSRRWLRTVGRVNGLATADGLMTLDAAPLVSPRRGIRLWGATWARRGRGHSVVVERGIIARDDAANVWSHGTTVAGVLSGIAKKGEWARLTPAERADREDARAEALVARLAAQHGNVMMTADDAREVGACEPGIADWRYRTGLDKVRTAPLRDVAEGWKKYPAPEAIAAMRHAIRASRSAA